MRTTLEKAKVNNVYNYEYFDYFKHMDVTRYIYVFTENDKEFVWKTTTLLFDENSQRAIHKGDVISITGTVKGEEEYKGKTQTIINRCKLNNIIEKAKTREEYYEEKKAKQIESLQEGDQIMTMQYRDYKNHYADCETLAGSYDGSLRTIDVIVRNGRLKPSGVRGQTFAHYRFKNNLGEFTCFKAVSLENAFKQAQKYKKDAGWEYIGISY